MKKLPEEYFIHSGNANFPGRARMGQEPWMKPRNLNDRIEQVEAGVKFPLVGIGASAGGLEALARMLPGLPSTPGFAIVLVMHLAPDQPSQCAEALQRFSNMPVHQVNRHPIEILANHMYVIAPGTLLKVEDNFLFLDEANGGRTTLGAIDYFFHSLALSHRGQAVGVLLSGMGHDGCGGLAGAGRQCHCPAAGRCAIRRDAAGRH